MPAANRFLIATTALVLCTSPALTGATSPYVATLGRRGSDEGEFRNPRGLCLDSSGNLYVVDQGNDRIQKFSQKQEFLLRWGRRGVADAEFQSPTGIAIGPGYEILVTDQGNNRVQVFDTSGVHLRTWGTKGTEPGRLLNPTGIAVDEAGTVYVCDTGNRRIQKFTSSGEFLEEWGPGLSSGHRLDVPIGISVSSTGILYLVDSGSNTLIELSTTGAVRSSWVLREELGIVVHQVVQVVSHEPDTLYLLDAGKSGGFLSSPRPAQIVQVTLGGSDLVGSAEVDLGKANLMVPSDLAIGSDGRMFVTDTGHDRVQLIGGEAPPPKLPLGPPAPPIRTSSISLEILQPQFSGKVDAGPGMVFYPGLEWSLSSKIAVAAMIPFVSADPDLEAGLRSTKIYHFEQDTGPPEYLMEIDQLDRRWTALGNTYMGVKFARRSARVYARAGIWLPTAGEHNLSGNSVGLLVDVSRREAFLPDAFSMEIITYGWGYVDPLFDFRIRLGWSYAGLRNSSDEFWIVYGLMLEREFGLVRLEAGIDGRLAPSNESIPLRKFQNQAVFQIDLAKWRLRPAASLRIWLNNDFREVVPAVLGVSLAYDLRR